MVLKGLCFSSSNQSKLGSGTHFTGKANLLKEYDHARFNEFLSWLNAGNVGVLIANNVNQFILTQRSISSFRKFQLPLQLLIRKMNYKKQRHYPFYTLARKLGRYIHLKLGCIFINPAKHPKIYKFQTIRRFSFGMDEW